MTEEIIIDGVNVAGCEFYLQDDKYSCDLSFINQEELCKCDDVQDCTYKQLKRLEQENKKLKKDVQLFKCLDTFGESECHCACRCLGNEFCEDADKKINNYRSALKEILEIIRADCKRCTAECDCDDDCTRYKIQNKINEVL